MPEILYCDDKCVGKLTGLFGSLTSDEITNDLLSAKDKMISKVAYEVADLKNIDKERMMGIFDFIFSHSNQLACSLGIIMVLGVIIALSHFRTIERLTVLIAATLNTIILSKVIFHYLITKKVCEEVSNAFSGDGLGGYALVGYLYSPILLMVELIAIFILTYIVFGRLTKRMGYGGTFVKLFIFLLLFTCGAMIRGHTLVSLGGVKPEDVLEAMIANVGLPIATAFIILTSYFICLISDLFCKARKYYEDRTVFFDIRIGQTRQGGGYNHR